MTCLFVNGSFILAMLGIVPGGVFGLMAQHHRALDAPPRRFWRDGWDLFRPAVFTEPGNQLRRRSLTFSLVGAAFLLMCVALIFLLRGDQPGLCWFQS